VGRHRLLVSGVAVIFLGLPVVARADGRPPDLAACRGTWEVVPSPSPARINTLFGSWGLSPSDAWAVGAQDDDPLALHWDGVAWTEVAVPSPGNASLKSVTATAANDVWAVGSYFDQGGFKTLVEHWDGLAWSIVASPPVESSVTDLNDVWAISSTDVWAVGVFTNPNFQTMTLHWNGIAWTVVPSPNRGRANGDLLRGVTATSPTDVWAVGMTDYGVDADALILHWAGATWDIVPQASADNDWLTGAFALSSSKVWAVGHTGFSPDDGPLTERWDGAVWSTVASQDAPGNFPTMADVTALSSRQAWAVGSSSVQNGNRAFVESLRGQRWRLESIPHVTNDDILTAVTSVRGPQIWAVGWYDTPSGRSQTLILDYC
jgi:hypothetical protein